LGIQRIEEGAIKVKTEAVDFVTCDACGKVREYRTLDIIKEYDRLRDECVIVYIDHRYDRKEPFIFCKGECIESALTALRGVKSAG